MKRADRAIVTSSLVVAASTAGLAAVTGYGTVVFQLVMLGAWSIVARLSSGLFADRHQEIVWLVTLVVNIVVFSVLGIPAMATLSKPFAKVGDAYYRLLDDCLFGLAVCSIPSDGWAVVPDVLD